MAAILAVVRLAKAQPRPRSNAVQRLTFSMFVAKALRHGAGLAQLVEQRFCKPKVAGSSPASGTSLRVQARFGLASPLSESCRAVARRGGGGLSSFHADLHRRRRL